MGKGRFTVLDVRAICTELSGNLVGLRIANVYDLNQRTYVLKFSGGDRRMLLLVESGIRIHLTEFSRETPPMPNGFASKLRKHLRSRKLTAFEQLGRDRVVKLTFGVHEDYQHHLIIEMHSGGNMILCDSKYTILTCLRIGMLALSAQLSKSSGIYSICVCTVLPPRHMIEKMDQSDSSAFLC